MYHGIVIRMPLTPIDQATEDSLSSDLHCTMAGPRILEMDTDQRPFSPSQDSICLVMLLLETCMGIPEILMKIQFLAMTKKLILAKL